MTIGELIERIQKYNPGADIDLVRRAYEYSEEKHRGQQRLSGEPYFTHPMAVAGIIADLRLDVPTVATGLLHDTIEDTLATREELDQNFGSEVSSLVDGVTKISRLEARNLEHAEEESIRKMLTAGAEDIRVLLVKLADRTHNLRTIEHLPDARRRRMASETLELYAPLANRLGVGWLRSELEETSFRALDPEAHAEVREKLSLHRLEREGYVGEIISLIERQVSEAGITAEVTGRTKSAYSIHRKMLQQGLKVDEVYDVVAFRILVDSDAECYEALGAVHMHWRPVPGRFRDYVALPKENRYQSLHTTVIGPYGERMEVQIRTHSMHRVAEYGVAAHWRYKSPDEPAERERFEWLRQLLEWQQHLDDAQFLSSFKEDLFAEEVIAFTPAGEAKRLKKGETALDFAYRVHTEVGNQCAGARVNGKLVPLRHQIETGDTVEIVTTETTGPTREWLKFLVWPHARESVLQAIRREEREKAIALGRELLERDLARRQFDLARLRREGRMSELLKAVGRSDEDALLEGVGYGRVTTRQVLQALFPDLEPDAPAPKRRLRRLFPFLDRQPRPLVATDELTDVMIRFGKCCEPLAGEPIVGFLTRGRGVTVHAVECPRLGPNEPERIVDVHWEKNARAPRPVRLEVNSRDRPGLLANMSQAIASAGVNIDRAHVRTTANKAINVFDMTLGHADELVRVTRNLKRVPGVKEVHRVYGGGAPQRRSNP